MRCPDSSGALRIGLGVFCDDRIPDYDNPEQERRPDRYDGSPDQLSLPCGIIRISVLALLSFP